jgi:DNA-binding NarL/FixJ family response regulator
MHLGRFCFILSAAVYGNQPSTDEVKQMRVFLADDQPKVRSALRLLLEQDLETSVVGEAAKAEDLLAQVQATRPDLLLLDWELPGLWAANSLLPGLRALNPCLLVIALSGRPDVYRAALAAGADAFVSKGDPPERLLSAVNDCWRKRYRSAQEKEQQ